MLTTPLSIEEQNPQYSIVNWTRAILYGQWDRREEITEWDYQNSSKSVEIYVLSSTGLSRSSGRLSISKFKAITFCCQNRVAAVVAVTVVAIKTYSCITITTIKVRCEIPKCS